LHQGAHLLCPADAFVMRTCVIADLHGISSLRLKNRYPAITALKQRIGYRPINTGMFVVHFR
jgi:hypothetical protein